MEPAMMIANGKEGHPRARLTMTGNQRQAIANGFEEGHYVMGISILDELCDREEYLPDHPLIRQLLYLSIYPYEPAQDSMDGNDLKRATFPNLAAADAANALLRDLADRMPPSHLLAALPFYPAIGKTPYSSPPRTNFDYSSNFQMVKEAERLAHCRSCWDILKQGFVPPLSLVRRTLPGSPTKRHFIESTSTAVASPSIIAPESWNTLHWLLRLFERDEQETERITGSHYSPLLLTQIPDRRSERGTKWDATVPLDIAFFCVERGDHEEEGQRLLTLLCNLTFSSDFDGLMFVNSLATRFFPGYEHIDLVLSFLPERTRFAVCRALLARPVSGERRGRTRTQPIARRKKADGVTNESAPSSISAASVINSTLHSLSSPTEVVQLLGSSWGEEADACIVKLHLFDSYLDLRQSVPTGEDDADWTSMVQTGAMNQIVEATFASREDPKDHLLAKLATCS
ncbi:hypothetical protein PENSPDRAFT_757684 [Peniophora sp. CONT]|nr:hypothetical protein PENSPDRAFT_757684 [Peniophora sp. CONT]